MKKTYIPNSFIFFGIIYLTIIFWAVFNSGSIIGIVFYSVILVILFALFIYHREKNACIIEIKENILTINYIFKKNDKIEIDLLRIKGNIVLSRYSGNEFIGGLPSLKDYLYYRWYFTAENYKLEFFMMVYLHRLQYNLT